MCEAVAQLADLLDGHGEGAVLRGKRRLVAGQRRFQAVRVAGQHAGDLRQAETEPAQGDNMRRLRQVGRAIGAPAGRVAPGDQQATLLIEPQCFGGHAEFAGGLGGSVEAGRWGHGMT